MGDTQTFHLYWSDDTDPFDGPYEGADSNHEMENASIADVMHILAAVLEGNARKVRLHQNGVGMADWEGST